MHKTSTPTTSTSKIQANAMGPSKKTLAMLRQFARIYVPMTNMPGIVLN